MKRIAKVVVALVLALAMAIPTVAFASQATPEEQGLIPVRAFFEDAGGTVTWLYEERLIHIAIDGSEIVLLPGQPIAAVNGDLVPLEQGAVLWQNISFISEADLMTLYSAIVPFVHLVFELTEEARDIVLYDFEYMVNQILENSPWDNVVYRALGFEFELFVDLFRNFINSMQPIELPVPEPIFELLLTQFPIREGNDARDLAANYLFALLALEFGPALGGIGHLGVRDLSVYTMQMTALVRALHDEDIDTENDPSFNLFMAAFLHPTAVWFYGEVEVDLESEDHPFPNVPGNIVTEILVPGEVAYLRINTFLASPEYDDLTTLPFLQQIADYDHLIIDLRGNTGGVASYFTEFIVRRLISERTEIGGHQFFAGGSRATEFMNAVLHASLYMESSVDWTGVISAEILPAADFIYEMDMYMFNQDDLERLAYVFISRSYILPAEDSINFEGKIWLLVDGMSMSASVAAAGVALYTGFATVVGENTSGVMGSSHIYVPLPNTGMLWRIDIGYQTDAQGNSLEVYGITPQIRNFDGMDAVETVLALIAAGQY